jgi:hypothetical protein
MTMRAGALTTGIFGVLLASTALIWLGSRNPASPSKARDVTAPNDSMTNRQVSSRVRSERAHQLEQAALDQARPLAQRAHAIQQLGVAEVRSSTPALIACLRDQKLVIRGRAGTALQRVLGTDFGFRAGDPPDRRKGAIAAIERYWESHREVPRFGPAEAVQ